MVKKDNPDHVLLLDFGVSEKHSSKNVQVQGRVGTKGWMAPEVERNQGFYDPFRADIWSVGAVIERLGRVRHSFALIIFVLKVSQIDVSIRTSNRKKRMALSSG